MFLIPKEVFGDIHLKTWGIRTAYHADYQNWFRYFLDFCDKYPVPAVKSERVRLLWEVAGEEAEREAAGSDHPSDHSILKWLAGEGYCDLRGFV